jgi:hypothetical protein
MSFLRPVSGLKDDAIFETVPTILSQSNQKLYKTSLGTPVSNINFDLGYPGLIVEFLFSAMKHSYYIHT